MQILTASSLPVSTAAECRRTDCYILGDN